MLKRRAICIANTTFPIYKTTVFPSQQDPWLIVKAYSFWMLSLILYKKNPKTSNWANDMFMQ